MSEKLTKIEDNFTFTVLKVVRVPISLLFYFMAFMDESCVEMLPTQLADNVGPNYGLLLFLWL